MLRTEVLEIINGERKYQEYLLKCSDRPDILSNFSMGDALSAIQNNLNKANEVWYKDAPPYTKTMDYLRKIAGITVKMGELHSMPERKI